MVYAPGPLLPVSVARILGGPTGMLATATDASGYEAEVVFDLQAGQSKSPAVRNVRMCFMGVGLLDFVVIGSGGEWSAFHVEETGGGSCWQRGVRKPAITGLR